MTGSSRGSGDRARRRRLLWVGVSISALASAVFVVVGLQPRAPAGGLHIDAFLHVNINCSDFEVSRRFYERLGFRHLMDVAPEGAGAVARAVGMERYRVRGALLAHPSGLVIDLLQWQEPRSDGAPYAALSQPGIARLALTTTDLDADVATLRARGVDFVSEQPGEVPDPLGGTTRFIAFRDPDGTVLELVEMGTAMGLIHRASQRFSQAGLR